MAIAFHGLGRLRRVGQLLICGLAFPEMPEAGAREGLYGSVYRRIWLRFAGGVLPDAGIHAGGG